MADYTLSYSGEELDEVCEKVQAINPSASDINSFFTNANAITNFFNHKGKLQMRWGTRVWERDFGANAWAYHPFDFVNIFPDNIDIEQSNPIVMVNCEVAFDTLSDNHRYFINQKVWCVRDGRTVTGECFLENSDNQTRHFKMNIYCLVIYTTDGSQGIE